MQIFKTKLVEFEAKENTSPTFQLQRQPTVSMSCGCTSIKMPSDDIYTIVVDKLPEVKYMVSEPTAQFYTKKMSVTINQELITIKIKVTT